MRILKFLGIFIIILVLIGFILVLVAPTQFSVERSISIDAPKSIIQDHIIYFEKSSKWSPWADLDPDMEEWIEGEDGTVGAKHFWKGNEEAGEGVQEITSIEDGKVEIKLTFIEPFQSEADSYFFLDEEDNSIKVTWGFDSEMPRPFNLFGLFMDMSEEIGKDYDKGLKQLKEMAEATAEQQPEWEIETVEFEEKNFLGHRDVVKFDAMQAFYGKHLGAIYGMLTENEQANIAGQPCGIYYDWDEENQQADVAASIPFSSDNDNLDFGKYETISLSGPALKLAFYGDYEKLGDAHMAIHDYLNNNDLPMSSIVLEEYVTDPESEPDPSKWLTNIYYFLEN